MSIPINAQCYLCHLRKNLDTARQLGTEAQVDAFARDLLALYLSAPADMSSPWLAPGTNALFIRHFNAEPDRFREEKQASNAFVLTRLTQIQARIAQAADPLLAGLQFAIFGNYIDFSALYGQVSFQKLDAMLDTATEMDLDMDTYHRLCRRLEGGKRLLYLTDNAGEIAFDRLFAQEIARKYPHLAITFCVRGAPAQNDATREDAAQVGIPFPVIDNGNAIPGTQLDQLSPEAARAMAEADVILSKGQGNAETLMGSGYPIFYAFLVKCPRFLTLTGKPQLTPVLAEEPTPREVPN